MKPRISNILMITPLYPSPDTVKGATPIVHYFTREWVLSDRRVLVINLPTQFPNIYYYAVNTLGLKSLVDSYSGMVAQTISPKKRDYVYEGVEVHQLPVKKIIPHSTISGNRLEKLCSRIISLCTERNFLPDVIIGHWLVPTLPVVCDLSERMQCPGGVVFHDSGEYLFRKSSAENDFRTLVNKLSFLGFRSKAIRNRFQSFFGEVDNAFYAYSGVPSSMIPTNPKQRCFDHIQNFVFVGTMIHRKYPLEVLKALEQSNITDYGLTYVGEGRLRKAIRSYCESNRLKGDVHDLGRIPRSEVAHYLESADVFVMISKAETFGLVYLEAMAAGCITIASENEGFDGIIRHGYNGFLCPAGDVVSLSMLINKIQRMKPEDLLTISENARRTATEMTDDKVAEQYLRSIEDILDSSTNEQKISNQKAWGRC